MSECTRCGNRDVMTAVKEVLIESRNVMDEALLCMDCSYELELFIKGYPMVEPELDKDEAWKYEVFR